MVKLDEPTDGLAEQRIALFGTFLYREGGLFITPTVRSEYQRIPDSARAAFHEEMTTLFPEIQPIKPLLIDPRVANFKTLHNDIDDCRILAESACEGYVGMCCRSIQNSFHVLVPLAPCLLSTRRLLGVSKCRKRCKTYQGAALRQSHVRAAMVALDLTCASKPFDSTHSTVQALRTCTARAAQGELICVKPWHYSR